MIPSSANYARISPLAILVSVSATYLSVIIGVNYATKSAFSVTSSSIWTSLSDSYDITSVSNATVGVVNVTPGRAVRGSKLGVP